MKVKEVFESVTGTLPNSHLPKANIYMESGVYSPEENNNTVIASADMYKPIVEIQRNGRFLNIDLKFSSAFDNDIKVLWNLITLYSTNANDLTNYNDESSLSTKEPSLALIIAPTELLPVYITAINPLLWALTSEKPGINPNIIRLVYDADLVICYEDTETARQDAVREAKEEEKSQNRNNAFYNQVENNKKQGFE